MYRLPNWEHHLFYQLLWLVKKELWFVSSCVRVQFELWNSDDVPVPRKELLEKVKGVDGLLCVLTEKIDAELLDAAGVTSAVFDVVEEPEHS